MPECMLMSIVSYNSLIAWKVDFFFVFPLTARRRHNYVNVVNLNLIQKF